MSNISHSACVRLRALGVSQRDTHQILDQIQKWYDSNGHEWTIARLKAFKQLYINRLAHRSGKSGEWISTRKNGVPKGPLGRLWHGTSPRHRARALNALMVYTTNVSKQVTTAQWRKFSDSLQKEANYDEGLVAEISALARKFPPRTKERFWSKKPEPIGLEDYVWGNTRAPSFGKTVDESEIEKWILSSANAHVVRKTMARWRTSHDFTFFSEFTNSLIRKIHSKVNPFIFKDVSSRTVGKIGFIQEPGFKLRAVANPNRLIQLALNPLKVHLQDVLERIPMDCTTDQGKGVSAAKKWLDEGRQIHSIDLSDATNNFPLEIQLNALSKLLDPSWKPYLDLFEVASRGEWQAPSNPDGVQTVSWTVGQPLGLGPSFMSFAFAHHLVAIHAWIKVGKPRASDGQPPYRILGDDIIIADDALADCYKSNLQRLDCPISHSKTITSDSVAEFAGKVVVKEGEKPSYDITLGKWRGLSDRNFLDLTKNVGYQFIGALRPKQKAIARLLAEVPEEYGGLGFNPKGKPYADRVTENLDTIRRLEDRQEEILVSRALTSIYKLSMDYDMNERSSLLHRFLNSASSSISCYPHRVTESGKSLEERIHSPLDIKVNPKSIPKGYKPVVKTSDPRGESNLKSLEKKLLGRKTSRGFSM